MRTRQNCKCARLKFRPNRCSFNIGLTCSYIADTRAPHNSRDISARFFTPSFCRSCDLCRGRWKRRDDLRRKLGTPGTFQVRSKRVPGLLRMFLSNDDESPNPVDQNPKSTSSIERKHENFLPEFRPLLIPKYIVALTGLRIILQTTRKNLVSPYRERGWYSLTQLKVLWCCSWFNDSAFVGVTRPIVIIRGSWVGCFTVTINFVLKSPQREYRKRRNVQLSQESGSVSCLVPNRHFVWVLPPWSFVSAVGEGTVWTTGQS